MNVLDFIKYKNEKKPISMITCYDSWSAAIIEESDLDCLLVGDSLAMTMHGYETTIPADTDLMALHTAAVRRGAPSSFIIADMPFLSFRKGLVPAMETVEKLMHAGANAVKLEGVDGHSEIISFIVESGVPVMGHLGLTPQSVNQLGGYKVQGKTEKKARNLIDDALALEEAGCFAIVLECVPAALAKIISEKLTIPTIGIGAGKDCDGQVLVLQDMLGLNHKFQPKFVRTFMDGFSTIKKALNQYDSVVKDRSFPEEKESYS
ncbi:MAG: 3-methyl-2-oxobutanoate hydroxymethyltransferase [Spirochaetaceae bacterium]|jgi:3-methyl-2-oxobutanoate hydroxymethyltransferase|nr:3-methyl-2-oxobutanoate hydroxymethyltransferase [Spirochaetaceae bacterium]